MLLAFEPTLNRQCKLDLNSVAKKEISQPDFFHESELMLLAFERKLNWQHKLDFNSVAKKEISQPAFMKVSLCCLH